MLGALGSRSQPELAEGFQYGSQGQVSPKFRSQGGALRMFQTPRMGALDLGYQGRTGPGFPGLGYRNLVQVSKKRILRLVEVLWENGDFRFSGSQGGQGLVM